ncbi:MAG: aminotransferase class I/II-fold pyridoxal phosphate-dependent enzyme [Selenomonadaceae bacterium]|nr:aminotransferase class I/II-fold pyridoxal phosphate-dependent enzyme [Selenomonadaceae bacterium]
MKYLTQERAPIMEALERMKAARLVPFDVPGHKRGRGNADLMEFLGQRCLDVDVNSMKPLDNLCHPISVIRDAEILAAQAFGAMHSFFITGGTTQAVQTMILAVCKPGDKIILPRNVHRSAINAMILCGAVPVYVNPQVDERLGISLGMKVEEIIAAIKSNPDAKAVLVNNPTYYGICSDIATITKVAHEHGMKVLADEAHGTHFYFNKKLPPSAMSVGADMAAVSMHKSGGSLTQSSLLLTGENINAGYVHQILNLTQTTSGSYLLMSSLDISRRNLALRGEEIFDKVIELVEYARNEINYLGGWYAYGKELIDNGAVYDFDITKLSIYTRAVGLAGVEVYDILRDEYDIQLEFGDIANILAYVSVGDRVKDIERLVSALADVKRIYRKDPARLMKVEYIAPIVDATPKEAFYSAKKSLPIAETVGETAAEFLMCYPPGIPILAPGERITKEILDYIRYAKRKGCQMTGPEDMTIKNLQVMT